MESLNVLIAEHDTLVSQELALLLTQLGHAVVGVTTDSDAAVEEALAKHPDLVLMDAQLAPMDGIEATQRIMDEFPMPVILTTSEADDKIAEKSADAGGFGYVVKPVTASNLVPAIAIAIRRFRQWQATRDELNQLKDSLETRKIAEQAKGIIMQRLQLPEGEAYAHLREKCRNQQKTMKQASQEIIEADRYFLEQLSKEPPSRMRNRYYDDRERFQPER